MSKNTKRERILKRLAEGADPMTIKREFDSRLEACGWGYILQLKREHDRSMQEYLEARQRDEELNDRRWPV